MLYCKNTERSRLKVWKLIQIRADSDSETKESYSSNSNMDSTQELRDIKNRLESSAIPIILLNGRKNLQMFLLPKNFYANDKCSKAHPIKKKCRPEFIESTIKKTKIWRQNFQDRLFDAIYNRDLKSVKICLENEAEVNTWHCQDLSSKWSRY